MTSFQVLAQIPSARGPTIQRLQSMVARSTDGTERQQLQAAVRQIEALGR